MAASLFLRNSCSKVTPFRLINLNKSLLKEGIKCSSIQLRAQQTEAYKHHDHTRLWTAERVVSAALLPIVPLAIAVPSPVFDYSLAVLVAVHSHWGLEAIVIDYIRPSIFGEVIPKISLGFLYMVSALTVGGLFYFNYSDVGIGQAIRMLWKL